jgi:hypothetical protein
VKKKLSESELKLLSQKIVEYLMNEIPLGPKNISLYAGCRVKLIMEIIDGQNFFKPCHFKRLEEAMPEIYVILFNYLLRKTVFRRSKKEPGLIHLSGISNHERKELCINFIENLDVE